MSIGGKAEGLVRLRDDFGVLVPAFLVVPFANAIKDFSNIQKLLAQAASVYFADADEDQLESSLADVKSQVRFDETYLALVHEKASAWSKVSFRTSALSEDGPDSSFAGQYESFVDIDYSQKALLDHARACFESMLSLRVLRYAKERGQHGFDFGGSFIVQEMFYGTSSGVLFTENGSGSLLIAASSSWRNSVVEGDDAIEYVVPRAELDKAEVPAHLRVLCQKALEVEAKVGQPLDFEWATANGQVAFLQMRPITVPNLNYSLEWDSTNISENYPGVTLPLTYSVIRELYAGVYKSFMRMIGTDEKLLTAEENKFRNMLGYINGQVYYRISNWYELLKLLPGRANQQFFEAMLNPVVTRGANPKKRRKTDARSFLTLLRFVWLLLRSESKSKRFKATFAQKLAFFKAYHVDFVNAAELLDASKKVRAELLSDWATPILNDVKLMVFHGLLKKYFFNSTDQSEYLAFLQGLSDRASLKPLEQLSRMGATIAQALEKEGKDSIEGLRATSSWHLVATAVDAYVTEFGSRTPGELKLESVRLTDDVTDVLEMALKAHESAFANYAAAHSPDQLPTKTAVAWPAHVSRFQRPLLRWVATNTRRAIDWRERFRFNRAQTFDLSRSLYDAVGKVLELEGLIENSRDIYWLTEQEIDEIVNAHAWSLAAKQVVALRKAQFEQHKAANLTLAVHGAGRIAAAHLANVVASDAADGLVGKGVAPGVLTAEVIVCKEFDASVDVRGKILVVHHIDPGWTLLFTQAAGIVAERGNALSHAAIIAREIGIPAVVAVLGATSALQSGDIITINGTLGSIARESS